ncbi:hypothetical protein, partial [uncultured Gammaproteobacteria bacterium]
SSWQKYARNYGNFIYYFRKKITPLSCRIKGWL